MRTGTEEALTVLDALPLGACVLQDDLVVVFWNTMLEAWTHIPRETILGTPLVALFPHLQRSSYGGRLKDIFAGGPPTVFSCQLHHALIPARLPNGQPRLQHTTVAPMARPDGGGYYAVLIMQDITELTQRARILHTQYNAAVGARRQAEGALRACEASTRAIVQSAIDGIVTFDQQGSITSWNPAAARFFGYTAEEVLGEHITMLFPASERQTAQSFLLPAVPVSALPSPEHSSGREMLCQHKNDIKFPLEILVNTVVVGTQWLHIGFLRDITERKHLEAQLRQTQKMEAIGTLAGGIAHDFNNMLAAILGYTELATYEVPDGTPAWHHLQEVLTAGRRAKELVQQILTFSRQHEQERKPVHLPLLIKEALQLLRASLPSTIDIRQSLDPAAATILADPTQIHQVLMNLCTNAEHAMRSQGGVLTISLTPIRVDTSLAATHPDLQPGPYVCLTIQDTGHGMSPEVIARIFEPFYTTKRVGEGTGMGLAMVHGIISRHGGAITVESQIGQGTAFHIYLPQIDTLFPAPSRTEDILPQGEGCILFVDDEAPLARLGQETLERLGYTTVVRTSSIEALAAFRAAPYQFDLVITDHTMPNMTGEALSCELRRIRPDIPIILCTGFSHTMTSEKAQTLGIDAFLMKPLVMRDLAIAIRRVLGQHSVVHARHNAIS